MWEYLNVDLLVGQTMKSVTREERYGNDEIVFETEGGEKFRLFHEQDCCESVRIEDISGDLEDLVGSPITIAEESSNSGGKVEYDDSSTWTFYRFATAKSFVTVRWLGTSNGYYSESVSFERV